MLIRRAGPCTLCSTRRREGRRWCGLRRQGWTEKGGSGVEIPWSLDGPLTLPFFSSPISLSFTGSKIFYGQRKTDLLTKSSFKELRKFISSFDYLWVSLGIICDTGDPLLLESSVQVTIVYMVRTPPTTIVPSDTYTP